MLFNSYVFIFAFLPVVFFAHAQLERMGKRRWAIVALVLASFVYYGWWKPEFLLLLIGSILANAGFGRILLPRANTRVGLYILSVGIACNLSVLAYFKYANFFVENVDEIFGTRFGPFDILLPIGVSFITFQKIAFLVDAYRGLVKKFSLVDFSLFVSFFPQLIAGPIVHHSEVIPQFSAVRSGPQRWSDASIGLTIFCVGLFKKVIIADTCAIYADTGYQLVHAAHVPSLALAWTAILAYSFQIYYDFSGYSDMAVGLARLFGIKFPANFNSPYLSLGMIEFWRRWHITLSRFLRDYLYFPLGGGRRGRFRRYLNLMIVMLLGGFWHGANWTFVLWGALHGAMLAANHMWRERAISRAAVFQTPIAKAGFVGLTFVAVSLAWIPFRSASLHDSWIMLSSAFPVPGTFDAAKETIKEIARIRFFWQSDEGWFLALVCALTWLAPNTYQIFARFEPVINVSPQELQSAWSIKCLDWKVAVAVAVIFWISVLHLSRVSPFLYFQF